MGGAGDRDDVEAEAERARRDIADAAVTRCEGVELSAANRAIAGGAREHQERERNLEAERRRPVERQAEAERCPRRAFAAQKHLARAVPGARQRGARRAPSEGVTQRSHEASSTIQATSSANDMPA